MSPNLRTVGVAVGQPGLVDEIIWSSRLGAHLTAFRQRAGLRRIDLARQIGVSDETVRLWEKGTVQPSRELLARLIALLSLEVADWSASDSDPQKPELPVVARRLREERRARGMSQATAVRLLDVAQATYASWETGRCSPAEQHHEAIASFLGIGVEEVTAMCEVPFTVDTSTWPPSARSSDTSASCDSCGARSSRSNSASRPARSPPGSSGRVPAADHLRRLAAALDLELAVLAASVPQREDRTPLAS